MMTLPKTLAISVFLLLPFSSCSYRNEKTDHAQAPAKVSLAKTKQASEIAALFDQWNASLATGNPAKVVANYAKDSVLIPTVSNDIRYTQSQRREYFKHFLANQPRGKIDHSTIRVFSDIATHSGQYTFTFGNGTKVPARFTFVYQKQPDGKWLIIEHHSSKMPESSRAEN